MTDSTSPPFDDPVGGKLRHSVAALIHGFTWRAGRTAYRIADDISVGPVKRSRVWSLYRRICLEQNVDDGEPLNYLLFIEFGSSPDLLNFPLDPRSPVSGVLTLLCVLAGAPLPRCRLMWSVDDFATLDATDLLVDYRPQIDHWEMFQHRRDRRDYPFPAVDKGLCRALSAAWNAKAAAEGRLSRALNFFQHAWLAHDLDLMCLNLAVVLETLCAPHSQSETTHQVAFNVAHLVGGDSEKKRETYTVVKKFYALRSALIHGGNPDWNEMQRETPPLFELVSQLLRRLLLSPDLAATMNDEQRRRSLFGEYLFPGR